jgi:anti-sigma regulatory factor (Ser/Thr protein kinase)
VPDITESRPPAPGAAVSAVSAPIVPEQGKPVNAMNAPALVSSAIPSHPQLTYGDWLSGYPLRTFLELGAYRQAAGCARGHARNVLAEWGLGHLEEEVIATVSELVANSVVATENATWEAGRPPVRLWLLGGPGSSGTGEVMVRVWDRVAGAPAPREAGEQDESGRGLGIVAELSGKRWECYPADWPEGGKVTRAIISGPWRDQSAG